VAPLIAALPAVLLIFLAIVAPGFLAPLADDRLTIVGVPLIVPVVLLFVGVVVAVAWIARRTRSPVVAIVLAAAWVPLGLFIVILSPAIVLIAVNLSSSGLDGP
jgi:hypothetical protein